MLKYPRGVSARNSTAASTAANFATEPESLDAWMTQFQQTSARHAWLVATAYGNDSILGFAKSGPHKARGAYAWAAEMSVYVHHEARAAGVGRALYGCLIPTLRAQGFVTLLAGITSPNVPSEKLHAAFGFTRCATFHRVGYKLGAWRDVGYWELALDPGGGPPGTIRPVAAVW